MTKRAYLLEHKMANQATIEKEIEVHANWEEHVSVLHPPLTLDTPVPSVDAYLVKNLFSYEECTILLEEAERFGFGKTNYPKHYRGNLRLTVTDESLAKAVWKRLEGIVPSVVQEEGKSFQAVGLNPRWRLAKYFPGDRFKAHVDTFYEEDGDGPGKGLKSMYTVNIYMNEDFLGGNTSFAFQEHESAGLRELEVTPKTGLCLLFRQPPAENYLHEGKIVEEGFKYLFRSDIMYRISK